MKQSVSLKTVILIVVALVILAACGIGAALYLNGQKQTQSTSIGGGSTMILPDANAEEGGFAGESLDELYRQMIEKAEAGAIVVNFSESIILPDGSSEAEVQIANPVENTYPMQFTINLEDTGEQVFESGLVPVGSHLSSIKLEKKLSAGEYPAVLTYKAYDEEKQDFVGTVGVSVLITVES